MLIMWRTFKIFSICVVSLVIVSVTRCQILLTEHLEHDTAVHFCSFFGRRSPQPDNTLTACVWYKNSSCCREYERQSYFLSNAKILSEDFDKSKLTSECFKHFGYLMCYVCAPNQNVFFRAGRLSVCRSSCDLLYDQCKTSNIDIFGTVEQLYTNGTQLCLSRKFLVVDERQSTSCFLLDPSLYVSAEGRLKPRFRELIAVSLFVLTFITNTLQTSPSSEFGCMPLLFLSCLKLFCSFLALVGRICKGTARRCNFSWFGKVTLIFVCVQLPFLTSSTSAQSLTARDVQSWADALSLDLKQFADKGMAFTQFKKLYDDVGYDVVNINPAEELKKIRDVFDDYVTEQQNLTSAFVHEVKELHARYQSSGLPNSDKPRSLHDLPASIYLDSDNLFKYSLPRGALKYDYRVGRHLLSTQSTVKIPDSVQRDSFLLVDTVNWTSNLESFFHRTKDDHPYIRYLYFGSRTGVFRVFPGIDWVRDFIGFPHNYEPRMQLWYMSRKTGPKDIVIIIDGSLSMQGRSLNMAKSVIRIILNMLNHQYYVNAILSASRVYNVKGEIVQPEARTRVLSCSEDSLVPATEHNIQELHNAIDHIEASGGSDHLIAFQMAFTMFENHRIQHGTKGTGCRNMIFFITDGKEMDGDVRCTPGAHMYMEDNSKKFNPGNICHFKYDYIIDSVNLLKASVSPMQVNIFSFLTNDQSDSTDTGEYLAGKLACENQGVLSKIVDERDYFNQMRPFFNYIERNDFLQQSDQFLSSYYKSAGDQSAVISMTQPVHASDKEHLGVVGVDVPLEKLESLLRDVLWAEVHAFIAILTDGSPLIHPLIRNSEKEKYIGLYSMETEAGKPEQFSEVMKMLLSRGTGSVPITRHPGRTARFRGFNYLLPTTSSEYFIAHIPESDYSIGVNIFPPDLSYRKLKAFTGPIVASYLHTLLAAKINPQISQLVTELEPRDSLNEGRLYTGMKVSLKHSVVALSSESFCNMSSFYDQYVETEMEYFKVQTAINGNPAQGSCSVLTSAAGKDINITRAIEDVWIARTAGETTGIISTFLLTVNGVMRIYPGVAIPGSELSDIAYQDWYLNALLHRGFLSVLGEHPSRHPPTKVVTLSQAFLNGDVNCTEETAKLCAELGLIAVLAIDVRLDEFRLLVEKSLLSSGRNSKHVCGVSDVCEYHGREFHCETKCLLIDSTANFILLNEFNIGNNSYLSFPEKYPFILNHLINLGVFVVRRSNDSHVNCHPEDDSLKEEPTVDPVMGSYYDGPVPLYEPEMHCMQELIYYIHNRTRMSELGGTVAGSLTKDPCYEGQFFISLVKDTNLYLVVIEGYVDISKNPFNFVCRLSSQALTTYRAPVDQLRAQCDDLLLELKDIETYSSTCNPMEPVPISCAYDDASRIVPKSFEVAVVTALFYSILVL